METRRYLRDGRAPIPRDARTSALMARIRSKNTGPERRLRALLRDAGLGGYRLHLRHVPGRPDVAFVGARVAVFVHGCYWHGCPWCQPPLPRTNRAWWRKKIGANRDRDRRKSAALRRAGWGVITIRECRLERSPLAQVRRVERALRARACG